MALYSVARLLVLDASECPTATTYFAVVDCHHLAGTIECSGTRLYVNGQLVKSNPRQHQAEGYTGYYRIGGLSPNDLNNSLIGSFDDLRIYHRVLTDQEIKYLASTSSVGTCIATVHTPPTTANAGADRSQCNNGSFTMQGNTPITGSGQWSVVSGTAVIASPSAPNPAVTGIPDGSRATLRWTISNGSCPATTDEGELVQHAPPTPPAAGTDLFSCGEGTL